MAKLTTTANRQKKRAFSKKFSSRSGEKGFVSNEEGNFDISFKNFSI